MREMLTSVTSRCPHAAANLLPAPHATQHRPGDDVVRTLHHAPHTIIAHPTLHLLLLASCTLCRSDHPHPPHSLHAQTPLLRGLHTHSDGLSVSASERTRLGHSTATTAHIATTTHHGGAPPPKKGTAKLPKIAVTMPPPGAGPAAADGSAGEPAPTTSKCLKTAFIVFTPVLLPGGR